MRALLTLGLLALLAGCGSNSNETAGQQPVTVTVTTTLPAPPPTTPSATGTAPAEPAGDCSAASADVTLPAQDLPDTVASVRRRIVDAARACDYDTLQEIALEQGEGFTFSYGAETSAADFWRGQEEAGEPLLRDLVTILSLDHTRNETGSYAWPSAYDEAPSDADWQALVGAGLYTQAEVDEMRNTPGAGGYLGWRTAITPEGDWQFFVAGD